jgi:hypothetical protein
MSRLTRILAPLAAAAALAAPTQAAHAASTLTYVFAVPCTSGATVSPVAGLTMPSGTYAVTVTGACTFNDDLSRTTSTTVATPCSAPVAGPVPCTSNTVSNIPLPVCEVTTGSVAVRGCPPASSTSLGDCVNIYVAVDTTCVNGFALMHHSEGAMTARFVDGNYADNHGALVVTAVWTPL